MDKNYMFFFFVVGLCVIIIFMALQLYDTNKMMIELSELCYENAREVIER